MAGSAALESLRLDGVGKRFGSAVVAVDELDLLIPGDGRLGVVGESGSGKSTLGRMLVGLETPTTGQVLVNGKPLAGILKSATSRRWFRRAVQYVSQDSVGTFEPGRKVFESVTFAARYLRRPSETGLRDALDEMLHRFALDPAVLQRYPGQLSGGQRQRLSVIRSLLVEPEMLICDEVTSALDVSVQARVLNALKQPTGGHRPGLVFITHGLPACAFVTDTMAVMHRGRIVESGSTDQIVENPAADYTKHLLRSYREMIRVD
ncbi:ABC transporter ATP-binding protein [Herbiconiux moechotypicola]|uniref:ABC transporter ATP-binding protein n=1 Tax=Herbiconiux moechotypicola TaxID=637393 RepID=A0ABN3DPJ0_9MICO|nr:ABC transporter ATP-binding protein [Herbiconiux moechotypicola]MCS5731682.1 ABC transporter ATP-binding protein [Herbiconiux moechotypicola]